MKPVEIQHLVQKIDRAKKSTMNAAQEGSPDMENASMPDQVKYQKLFMGIILASFTHELRNQLAFVKELSGLQQDRIAIDHAVRTSPDWSRRWNPLMSRLITQFS